MKVERAGLDAGAVKGCHRLGSLDRQKDTIERRNDALQAVGERPETGFVLVGIAGVRHDHKTRRAEPGDDQIVDDARRVGEEERVFGLPLFQRQGIERAGLRQERRAARAGHFEQFHVGNIEQPGMIACVKVLLHHARRIGERHPPAGESAEARPREVMQIFERQFLRFNVGHDFSRAHTFDRLRRSHGAPLSEA